MFVTYGLSLVLSCGRFLAMYASSLLIIAHLHKDLSFLSTLRSGHRELCRSCMEVYGLVFFSRMSPVRSMLLLNNVICLRSAWSLAYTAKQVVLTLDKLCLSFH